MEKLEQWEMLELSFAGKSEGNPFTDYEICAEFVKKDKRKEIRGFYDGDGIYKVRFMPEETGTYSYRVFGSFSDISYEGEIEVTKPVNEKNHGMVQVFDQTYLAYADGTPHYSFGTTCYAWVHQTEELREQTLKTLSASGFNKIRFCIFPKFYLFNETEPEQYPYVRGQERGIDRERRKKSMMLPFHTETDVADITDFDCYQFNVEMFRQFDKPSNTHERPPVCSRTWYASRSDTKNHAAYAYIYPHENSSFQAYMSDVYHNFPKWVWN